MNHRLRFLTDEDFDNDIVRGLLQRLPDLDVVRVQDAGLPLHRAIPMRDHMMALSLYEGVVSFEGSDRISARMEEPGGNK